MAYLHTTLLDENQFNKDNPLSSSDRIYDLIITGRAIAAGKLRQYKRQDLVLEKSRGAGRMPMILLQDAEGEMVIGFCSGKPMNGLHPPCH